MLKEFAPQLYVADGPVVSFYGFPYPTRMAVVRLSDGGVWVWSPVALTPEIERSVEDLGPVRHLVSPNRIHHLFLAEWAQRWPDAKLHASPGLAQRKTELSFDAELGDEPDPSWQTEIDQVVFRGSPVLQEVVFFHRVSSTAIVCDLIQRHPRSEMTGWKGLLMRLDGLVGEAGSTPREWRATFFRRQQTRIARDRVLAWKADRLLIAHGDCVESGAAEIIENALAWI